MSPIKPLSKSQLAGLLTGKITNWSEVGGEDQPVVVVSEERTGAMRTEITQKVLDGKDFSPQTKVVELASQVPALVAATPGAIGFMSSALPVGQRAGVHMVPYDGEIKQTLFVITRPNASSDARKVVEAIKEVASRTLFH